MKILLSFVLALAFCATAIARTPKSTDGVLVFQAQLGILKGLIVAAQLDEQTHGVGGKIRDEANQQKVDLDRTLKPALNAVKGNADLVKAIKKCYVAAQSYLDSVAPFDMTGRVLEKRSESDLDNCQNELKMEINLAGITL